ncbi:hypothetical protein [Paenibacillus segetis]|uniref:Uncharacterized protein n=1 Tax=Paenibacillus segetis TaxID=1325360 RepID=A0ABQ1Y932_9BACL|nr:hypothetical protein [Paenibacillus segetis]GGH17377.1 hypothetical protein GCM10008013_12660 [Paenibacillus segetis]
MKTLIFIGETYEAERIVKTANSITGYNGNDVIFAFRGISDFSGFEIDGEWDDPELSIEDTLGNLLFESALDKTTIATLEDTVGNLLLEVALMKGGAA